MPALGGHFNNLRIFIVPDSACEVNGCELEPFFPHFPEDIFLLFHDPCLLRDYDPYRHFCALSQQNPQALA